MAPIDLPEEVLPCLRAVIAHGSAPQRDRRVEMRAVEEADGGKRPTMTAMPHPKVMTIHPEFSAFDLASTTAATTPSPSRINIPVPMISDGTMPKCGT